MVYVRTRPSASTPLTAQDTSARHSMTRSDAKTLVLAALGGALEYYDFIIFVFFTGVIG